MVKGNELVWRALADAAIDGKRNWQNLSDLAFQSGVPLTTTHLATRKLVEIGAIKQYPGGGLSTVSPEKILTLLCAWRSLGKDKIVSTTREAFSRFVESKKINYALGGPDAAIQLLGGKNKIADFSQSIAYLPRVVFERTSLPEGNELLVLAMDKRAEINWEGFTSFAQTYADLFATPGWQAAEFFFALRDSFLARRDFLPV